MKPLAPTTLARPLIGCAVLTILILASNLLGRQASSELVGLGIGLALSALAVILEIALYLVARRELNLARNLGRVSGYGKSVSIYDNDSGLYADWYFGLRLHEEIARSYRHRQPFTLLFIEDSEGYLGENVKRLVFQALSEAVRNTDIVAHLTDRRFAVMLTNTDRTGALVAGDRLRERLPLRTIALRMSSYPDDGRDEVSLLTSAGASPELISAITRGIKGTRTSILQSDWARPDSSPIASDAKDQRHLPPESEVEPALLIEDTAMPVLQETQLDPPANVIQFPSVGRRCVVAGCRRAHHARGLCARHYAAERRRRVA